VCKSGFSSPFTHTSAFASRNERLGEAHGIGKLGSLVVFFAQISFFTQISFFAVKMRGFLIFVCV
jgi:hypothetical protein